MADKPSIENSDYWRSRAEEARAIADMMDDPEARRTMLGIADGYDRMAVRAAARAAAKAAGQKSDPTGRW